MSEENDPVEISETIPDALHGERLDRVVSMLDGCSRAVAAELIVAGKVRLDGHPVVQKSRRVDEGSRIEFPATAPEQVSVEPDSDVTFGVVYSDDHIIVVNKPAGLVVHPGAGRPDATMANGLVARFPEIVSVGDPARPGIVHRLDADTSGLLIVARSADAYPVLVEAMSVHAVDRIYTAIVDGLVVDDRGVIDAPIGRSTRQRTRMSVSVDGRAARTHYEVLARSSHSETSLLRCQLETGRTHQIRVHLAAISHPVLGDTTYGPRTGSAHIGRVCLHARQLGFDHPVTRERMMFEAPLPDDIVAALASAGLTEPLGDSGVA